MDSQVAADQSGNGLKTSCNIQSLACAAQDRKVCQNSSHIQRIYVKEEEKKKIMRQTDRRIDE